MINSTKKIFILFPVLFYTIFILNACTKYTKYIQNNNVGYINLEEEGVSKVSIVKWKVGPLRRQTLSKGVIVTLKLPLLKKVAMSQIAKKFPINSWLIRVKKVNLAGSNIVGHYKVPIYASGRPKKALRIKQQKNASLSIYYAAAAISTRLEKFACPALNHRKIITKTDITLSPSVLSSLTISDIEKKRILAKVEPFSYHPSPINAGMSLIGEYYFEIAIYDSSNKITYSNFVRMPYTLEIKEEKNKSIHGCQNFTPPPRQRQEEQGIHKFKFGR